MMWENSLFFHYSWHRTVSFNFAVNTGFQVERQPFNDHFQPLPVTQPTVLAQWDWFSPTLLLGPSFSEAFARHFCGSPPEHTHSLDCVGATSVIAYLVSNYPCLSHSQPTQALIEFLSLWVMSYLSWEPSVSFAGEKKEDRAGVEPSHLQLRRIRSTKKTQKTYITLE